MLKWKIALLDESGKKVKVPRRHKEEPDNVDAYDVFSSSFKEFFDFGIIHGMTGENSLPTLRGVVRRLGTEGIPNYWVATSGNVGAACKRLAKWAEQYPKAHWNVE
jgi:hypothetical protein